MDAIEEVEWEACFLEPSRNHEVERQLRRELGIVPPVVRYLIECPWIARSLSAFNIYRGMLAHLDIALAEKIELVVSRDNSCRYCFGAQRLLMRVVGVSEESIRRLEQEQLTAELDPRERAALDFARQLSRSSPLPGPGDLEPLTKAGLSPLAAKEVALVAGILVFFNRVVTLAALPPERIERLPDRWLLKLVRPLLARRLLARRRAGQPAPPSPEEVPGPFDYLVRGLGDLPLARSLRQVVDEAWESRLLTRRTKGLVLAVVARGLSATRAEGEARALLAEEGLAGGRLDAILTHLGAPDLDPVAAEALPFARDTIRYRPAPIQRRARQLRERLGQGRFLELAGIAALANTLARLELVGDAATAARRP